MSGDKSRSLPRTAQVTAESWSRFERKEKLDKRVTSVRAFGAKVLNSMQSSFEAMRRNLSHWNAFGVRAVSDQCKVIHNSTDNNGEPFCAGCGVSPRTDC